MTDEYASVRYLVDDVEAAIDFYTKHLGFTLLSHPAPPFADVTRGSLRLLLSGPQTSGARATPDGTPAGRNRIHLVVEDLESEIERAKASCPSCARRMTWARSRSRSVPMTASVVCSR